MAKYNYKDYFYWDLMTFANHYDSIYEDSEFTEHVNKVQIENAKFFLPTLIEDGGTLDDLEELSLLIHNENAHAYMTFFVNKDLKKYYSDELISIIRKHVLSCSKVSNDPIYKEIIKQNKWDTE